MHHQDYSITKPVGIDQITLAILISLQPMWLKRVQISCYMSILTWTKTQTYVHHNLRLHLRLFLEHPHQGLVMWPSNIKIRWRKVNICRFGSWKWFFSWMFSQFVEAGKKHRKAVHLLEKSVINMIWLLVFGFDWPIRMIGPSGLLLVVPTYLQLLFQFYGWGCKK
jgi:hypothetical protein